MCGGTTRPIVGACGTIMSMCNSASATPTLWPDHAQIFAGAAVLRPGGGVSNRPSAGTLPSNRPVAGGRLIIRRQPSECRDPAFKPTRRRKPTFARRQSTERRDSTLKPARRRKPTFARRQSPQRRKQAFRRQSTDRPEPASPAAGGEPTFWRRRAPHGGRRQARGWRLRRWRDARRRWARGRARRRKAL
jgi:hypothetical protein